MAEAEQAVGALDEQGGEDDEADRAWQRASARRESIEDRIAAIDRTLVAPDLDAAALAGAVVALDHQGRIEILDGLIRPQDKRKASKAAHGGADEGKDKKPGTFQEPSRCATTCRAS